MIKDELTQKLKEAREDRQVSLQDAAHILAIRVQILQDLEDGCYDRLGALIYVKSYVRKYAAYLKINRDEIDALLAQLEDPFKQERSESIIRAQLNEEKRMVQRSFFRWYSIILAILLFVGILVYFVYGEKVVDIFHIRATPDSVASYRENSANSVVDTKDSSIEKNAVIERVTDELLPTSVQTDVLSNDLVIDAEKIVPTAAYVSAVNMDSVLTEFEVDQILRSANLDLPTTEEKNVDAAPILPKGISSLSITLNNTECWIQIKDKNQKVLMNEILPANATYHLEGAAPFSLHIGNATSIDKLLLNGEVVDEKIYRPTARTTVSKIKLSPKEEN